MSLSKHPDPENSTLDNRKKLGLRAKWWGLLSAKLCGLLILATLATTILAFTIRDGDTGGAMGVGMLFFLTIPMASIPVGLICLVGTVLSLVAIRNHPSPEARTALVLSLVSPAAVIVCYALCLAIILASGV